MQNFIIDEPTILHFGRDVLQDLPATVESFGPKVLLLYGQGSIKKTGLYDKILSLLAEIDAEVIEYGGIKPNPLHTDIDRAAELGREHNVDVILAVGGGSVLDSAKMLALTIPVDFSVWDFFTRKIDPENAIPVISVLTLAATGSEMNMFAVIQNDNTREKLAYAHYFMYPAHSFLDPELTSTVNATNTAYGIVDLMAHCLENYFGTGGASLTDKVTEAILREAIEYGPLLMKDLGNYELREKIMWAATLALNGTTARGRMGDWGVHRIEHSLSALYDIAHGAGLAIVFPAWLKLQEPKLGPRIAALGKTLFGSSDSQQAISDLEKFFGALGCPSRLNQLVPAAKKDDILANIAQTSAYGNVHVLEKPEMEKLVDLFI